MDEDEENINITSAEEFAERFETEQRKKAKNTIEKFLSKFGEGYAEAFQAIFVDGVSPREYLGSVAELEDLENLDLERDDVQTLVLTKHYKELGFDDARIAAKVKKLEEYGDKASEAADIHKVLVTKQAEKTQRLTEEAAQKQQQLAEDKKRYNGAILQIVKSKLQQKAFDSIPVDQQSAQEVLNILTQEKYRTKDGKTFTEFEHFINDLNNPTNYETKVKVAFLINLLKKDPTLSKITNKKDSEKSEKLFGKLIKEKNTQTASTQKKDKITSFI